MTFPCKCKCAPHKQQSGKEERDVHYACIEFDVPEDLIVIDRIRDHLEERECLRHAVRLEEVVEDRCGQKLDVDLKRTDVADRQLIVLSKVKRAAEPEIVISQHHDYACDDRQGKSRGLNRFVPDGVLLSREHPHERRKQHCRTHRRNGPRTCAKCK